MKKVERFVTARALAYKILYRNCSLSDKNLIRKLIKLLVTTTQRKTICSYCRNKCIDLVLMNSNKKISFLILLDSITFASNGGNRNSVFFVCFRNIYFSKEVTCLFTISKLTLKQLILNHRLYISFIKSLYNLT